MFLLAKGLSNQEEFYKYLSKLINVFITFCLSDHANESYIVVWKLF